MLLYKLTDENDRTMNETQWGENVTHEAPGIGELCTNGWIYTYTHPYLAILLNPIYADFENPHLWLAEGEIDLNDNGLKVGCTKLTTIKRLEIPEITLEQKAIFAIKCAQAVYHDANFNKWANEWINNIDRSLVAAWSAAEMARAATRAATWTTEMARAATRAAAWAAAEMAVMTAKAAAETARVAVRAAAETVKSLDLISIAEEVIGKYHEL